MKICLCSDNTLPLPMEEIVRVLNNSCKKLSFSVRSRHFRINSSVVSYPKHHKDLLKEFAKEIKSFDYVFLTTNIPYEGNYFFHAIGGLYVISFSGWNLLTDLSAINGLLYFIAEILSDALGTGERHEINTGCINDFLWDKTGIDIGMRSAFICSNCMRSIKSGDYDKDLLDDIEMILDLLSRASRSNRDILSMAIERPSNLNNIYDAFLCHNSEDKPEIRKINGILKAASISTWFDEEELPLGMPWQPELEKHIKAIRSAAVFVGENGIGPWQNIEVRAFLSEFVDRGCPVIPVILSSAKSVPDLPIFLRQMTWVDLRVDYDDNLNRLLRALRRKRN